MGLLHFNIIILFKHHYSSREWNSKKSEDWRLKHRDDKWSSFLLQTFCIRKRNFEDCSLDLRIMENFMQEMPNNAVLDLKLIMQFT